jgi:CRISPR/Cas system Type II protein with McrA/HNH and RuvC-like nuclease domain
MDNLLVYMQREDLFTPVHKGIRSMIYELGKEMQTTDFTDKNATERMCARIKNDFKTATSACVLCLLPEHADDESQKIFPEVRAHEPKMIETLLEEHRLIEKKMEEISESSNELNRLENLERRIEDGYKLNQVVNDFFAYYATHMNKEEKTLVPAMQKYFTDEQIAGMRAKIMQGKSPERLAEWMRWMLPSLNINELVGMVNGLKKTAPPQVFEGMSLMVEKNIGKEKWGLVKAKLDPRI